MKICAIREGLSVEIGKVGNTFTSVDSKKVFLGIVEKKERKSHKIFLLCFLNWFMLTGHQKDKQNDFQIIGAAV